MKASDLFKAIEEQIPLNLACKGDLVGYRGRDDPDQVEIQKILVAMDYLPDITSSEYDLIILHHPPMVEPKVPVYVIHSNWDIITGGAADILAETLGIGVDGILMPNGIGRIGNPKEGPVSVKKFIGNVQTGLRIDEVRVVNRRDDQMVSRIGLVPGFGLNPEIIKVAHERGADLLISGDLTHPGAILAENLGIILIDATHHATELPGLRVLSDRISQIGLQVRIQNTGIPWRTDTEKEGPGGLVP